MKMSVNQLLEQNATSETRAVVIDADTLQSSKALLRGGALAQNIYVINSKKSIVAKARLQGHAQSVYGISTNILQHLNGPFDIIYLDYCGTPDDTFNGFKPRVDIWWAAANLAPGGFVVVTFSKRTADAKEKARALVPSSLALTFDTDYYETCAMYMMVLSPQKRNTPLRFMFESMYAVNTANSPVSVVKKAAKPPKKVPKQAKKATKKFPKQVKKAMKTALYAVGDRVGVNYKMKDTDELEMFYAKVLRVKRTSNKTSFKYFLKFEEDNRSYFLNEDNITCKAPLEPVDTEEVDKETQQCDKWSKVKELLVELNIDRGIVGGANVLTHPSEHLSFTLNAHGPCDLCKKGDGTSIRHKSKTKLLSKMRLAIYRHKIVHVCNHSKNKPKKEFFRDNKDIFNLWFPDVAHCALTDKEKAGAEYCLSV